MTPAVGPPSDSRRLADRIGMRCHCGAVSLLFVPSREWREDDVTHRLDRCSDG